MADVMTYVIIGLFVIFLAYFLYTVLDVFFLSKRKRRVKSPMEKTKAVASDDDKLNDEASEASEDSESSKSSDQESDAKEEVEKESKNESKKDSENGVDDLKRSDIVSSQVKSKNIFPKSKKILNFNFFNRFKKKKKPIFEPEKIDEKYHELVVDFVSAKNSSWTQTDFYDFVLNLVKKGYDRKPSEISEDLEIVKKELAEERRIKSEANLLSKSDQESSNDSDAEREVLEKGYEISTHSDAEETASEKSSSKEKEEKDVDSEKELKELVKKNKESVDTRSELDKTLEEIRAIRKRLSGKD